LVSNKNKISLPQSYPQLPFLARNFEPGCPGFEPGCTGLKKDTQDRRKTSCSSFKILAILVQTPVQLTILRQLFLLQEDMVKEFFLFQK
jgi:hypothetical protein